MSNLNSILNNISQSFNSRWLIAEETASNWTMNFFDDPMYSQNPSGWYPVSLILLKPETSMVLADYCYQHLIHQLLALFSHKALLNWFKLLINELIRISTNKVAHNSNIESINNGIVVVNTNVPKVADDSMFTTVDAIDLNISRGNPNVNNIHPAIINHAFPYVTCDVIVYLKRIIQSGIKLVNSKTLIYKRSLFPFLLILAKKKSNDFFQNYRWFKGFSGLSYKPVFKIPV